MIGVSVGQFECRRLLGEGGTGVVYLAVHRVLNTPRAVKVLKPEWSRYPELVQRFINEARAAAAIEHRNIIGVHDCGQLPNGDWYILLDYLEGGTLSRYIASHGGPLAAHDVLHVIAEVANGLQAAHDRGIVHRDLKPDNIHLSARDGDPHAATILDFGVAKLRDRGGGATTAAGSLIGTPAYMAPEQLRGAKVGPAADVFALGVIAYQMVSGGTLPFQRGEELRDYYQLGPVELYQRITTERPGELRRRNPSLSPGWLRAIHAALDPDPEQRPPSPRAFALRLAEATCGDGFSPGGVEILRSYARELLEVSVEDRTLRATAEAMPESSARRYQTIRRIGAGGMAEVFEGALLGAEGFARAVAIKRVRDDLSREPRFSSMFIAEARLASQLAHPNLVSVIDFDRDPEGRPFLVMEYVAGMDLAALLRRGALPAPEAIFIVSELLRGLGYAHALLQRDGRRGLVHRDLSPHNILLSYQGEVKVSDFGIAAALEQRGWVSSTMVSGKASYMSPEQVHAQPLDARSDLFAVGIIFWEMLTGERLFQGFTIEAMARVIFKDIARPSLVRAGVPAELDAVVMKLLERDPRRRYGSALEAIEALMACSDSPRDGRGALVQLVAARSSAEPASHAERGGDGARMAGGSAVTVTSARPGTRAVAALATGTGVELETPGIGEVLVAATARAEQGGAMGAAEQGAQEPRLPAGTGEADVEGGALAPALVERRATTISALQGEREGRRRGAANGSARWLWPWRSLAWMAVIGALATIAATTSAFSGAGHLLDATAASTGEVSAAPEQLRAGAAAPELVAVPATPVEPATPAEVPAEPARPEVPVVSEVPAVNASTLEAEPRDKPAVAGAKGRAARTGSHGVLVVAVNPWATVWINGRSYGETPVQARLPVGRHRVRLINARGQRDVTISISAARSTLIEQDL